MLQSLAKTVKVGSCAEAWPVFIPGQNFSITAPCSPLELHSLFPIPTPYRLPGHQARQRAIDIEDFMDVPQIKRVSAPPSRATDQKSLALLETENFPRRCPADGKFQSKLAVDVVS